MREEIKIKIQLLDKNAIIPKLANSCDAGCDLIAIDEPKVVIGKMKHKSGDVGIITDVEYNYIKYIEYRTGIAIEPPSGYHTEIFPRSSIYNYDLILANSIGLVDESYRGELIVRFKFWSKNNLLNYHYKYSNIYKKGDRIAQLVIRKTYDPIFVECEKLTNTERGEGGFGSTGK